MRKKERPSYLPVSDGQEGYGYKIKIANPSGESELYFNKENRKRYEELPSSIGEDFECIYGGCGKMPQTVCPACNGYICEEHLYRHPNCEEGR